MFHKILIKTKLFYINCTIRFRLHLHSWNPIKNVKYGAFPSLMTVLYGCYPNLLQTRVFGIRLSTLEHDGLLMRTRIPPFSEKTCLRSTLVTGFARLGRLLISTNFLSYVTLLSNVSLNTIVTTWSWWRNGSVGGNSFGFRPVARSKNLVSESGNGWTTDKAVTSMKQQPQSIFNLQNRQKYRRSGVTTAIPNASSIVTPHLTSLWQTIGESDAPWWKFYGHSRKCCMLGTIGCTIASQKTRLSWLSTKSVRSLFQAIGIAENWRGHFILVWGRSLGHTRWIFGMGENNRTFQRWQESGDKKPEYTPALLTRDTVHVKTWAQRSAMHPAEYTLRLAKVLFAKRHA